MSPTTNTGGTSNTIDHDDPAVDCRFANFPLWNLVADHLEFSDVLHSRQVCRSWRDGVTRGISLDQCVNHLHHRFHAHKDGNSNNGARGVITVLSDLATKEWSTSFHISTSRERITKVLQQAQHYYGPPTQVENKTLINNAKGRKDEKGPPPLPQQQSQSSSSSLSHFHVTLRILRVLHYFPTQMAICLNAEWGRHCFGMQWTTLPPRPNTATTGVLGSGSGTSEPIVYNNDPPNDGHKIDQKDTTTDEPCSCSTCQKEKEVEGGAQKISAASSQSQPTTSSSAAADSVSATANQTTNLPPSSASVRRMDTSQYRHDPSIPNLPLDLLCPVCAGVGSATTTSRTLMLSEFSYQGSIPKPSAASENNNNPTSTTTTTAAEDEITPLGYRVSNVLTLTPTMHESSSSSSSTTNSTSTTITTTTTNCKEQDSQEIGCTNEDIEEANKKRRRVIVPTQVKNDNIGEDNNTNNSMYPPLSFQDLAIPIDGDPIANNADDNDDSGDDTAGTLRPPLQQPPPLHPKPRVKHVMSIHCIQCQQFAMIAPAGLCWSSRFSCLTRSKSFPTPRPQIQPTLCSSKRRALLANQEAASKTVNGDDDGEKKEQGFATTSATTSATAAGTKTADAATTTTRMGGMLVRTSCSEANCHRPVFCHECSHATQHANYPFPSSAAHRNQSNHRGPPVFRRCIQLQHCSRCDSCKLDYCPAHAWLSTVCHHW